MRYWLRKNWLIAVTAGSLALNVGSGVALYRVYEDPGVAVGDGQGTVETSKALDYERFMDEWGRAWLGLDVCDVTPEVAARVRLHRAEGALVGGVVPGAPADKAGVEPGDVIVSFNAGR